MKKKIVILSAFFRPFRSGAEACVEEIPTRLRDQFDFTILTARLRKGLPKEDTFNGVRVVRLGIGSSFDKWFFPFLAPFAARKQKPDCVHAVLESFAGAALMLCRIVVPSAHRILTCQSTNTSLLVGWMHKVAQVVTVISKTLQDRAEKFGMHDSILIPNGLNLSDIPKKNKISARILFAGRLEPMKGIDVLLDAFAKLSEVATLHIVGDGSLREKLEVQAKENGIAERVTFLGFVPMPEVYGEFAEAEIFCGLSRSEAFGNVFAEAQAAECAVVATKVGGIPDIVTDGETGLLVPPDDVQAATEALARVLEDAELRSSLASAGKESAQKYDWADVVERYAEVYRSLFA